ncbi:MAG TPA: preprotein translocase subunit YajC [Tenuifilaceae bacterium]|jgi:preprotein translocase subunit YajC|nr:preprotein translocase subunit YajC [Tenuifilaceae bacterium]HPI70057.1 preprotein translocase subunit YajC [Tenuifilaceae bacterium]
MTTTLFVLLQQQQPKGFDTSFLLMMGLVFVIIYFFMIRPQVKRQKELRKFQESLAKGDKVIVAGGIMGKVFEITETHVVVEISDNVRIKVVKSTVLRDSADLQQK